MNWHDRRYSPERHEHEREIRDAEPRITDLKLSQQWALVRLIGYCEGIAASGILGEVERDFRRIIAENLTAFGLPSKAEREHGNA